MGRPQLLAERCSSCVFRSGNLMHLRPGRLAHLIQQNLDGGAALICHQTLSYGDHPEVGEAVCRGFYDAYGDDVNEIRVMERIGGFNVIPAPTKEETR
jgi:hypothetical protein